MLNNFSTKKSLGVLGTLIIYFISIFVILKNIDYVEIILILNIGFVCTLFGIKAYTGIKAKKIDCDVDENNNS
jgi:hypothetical protein